MRRSTKRPIAAFVAAILILAPMSKVQALSVFDGANYSQNLLTAVRNLQQINNQIRQLQNEANMLLNMARNLERLDYSSSAQLQIALAQINILMQRAQGIAFEVTETETEYATHYPYEYAEAVTIDQLVRHARTRWEHETDAYRDTLLVQAQTVQNVRADNALLDNLMARSQSATGNLQVAQAGNQLAALQVKQQMQTQQLLAAQFRALALGDARQAADEEQARVEFERFMGSRNAYTPLR
ncbi:MAG: P-type conjugative transfer protein TrbJ [Kiloniellales bacterium]|nr:P-type conjugative transfer protein TrbJ [Kiloniellales bacterium]